MGSRSLRYEFASQTHSNSAQGTVSTLSIRRRHKIEVNAVDLKEITAESSSGLGSFSFQKMPERAKLSASSGDITVSLPEDADFTAHIDTSSGDFSYDLPLSKSEDGYVCGNGTNTVTINTSSGDIQLLKY